MKNSVLFWGVVAVMMIVIVACKSGPSTKPGAAAPKAEPVTGAKSIVFIVPPELPDAILGSPYSYSFAQPTPESKLLAGGLASTQLTNPTGGVEPYTFQRGTLSEFLPWGLTLHPNGILDGTPDPSKAKPGAYALEICAIDNTRSSVCKKTVLNVREVSKTGGGAFDETYQITIRGTCTWRKFPDDPWAQGGSFMVSVGNNQVNAYGRVVGMLGPSGGTVRWTEPVSSLGTFGEGEEDFVLTFSRDPSVPGGVRIEGTHALDALKGTCRGSMSGKVWDSPYRLR